MAPYSVALDLAAGTHRLGIAVTHNGVRQTLGTGGVVATITVTEPAPTPPDKPRKPRPPKPPRLTAPQGQTTTLTALPGVRWGGRRYATAASLREHIQWSGGDWEAFLATHPAVVATFDLRPVSWDGRRFYSRSGLARHLARNGIRYAGWAARHPRAAETLAANAAARAKPKLPRS